MSFLTRHQKQDPIKNLSLSLFTFEPKACMATSTAQKLKIKENFTLLTINAPADFKKNIGELPKGVKIST